MNEIVNPAIQFEKEITKLKIKSNKQLLVGIGIIILLGISFIQIINIFLTKKNSENQGNNAIIAQEASLFTTNQLLIILVVIILILVFFQTIQIKKSIETNNTIKRLFQLYGIKTIARNKGQIEISEKIILTIEWNSKGFFIIKKYKELISFASSSELYWRLIYYSNKYKDIS